MDLIFWRHAQAIEAESGCDDLQRPLTRKGEKQALRMATWLDRQLPSGTKILASPSVRTEQTAMALNRKYTCTQALAPNSNTETILELVQWPHAKGCTLIIGHQPVFGQTIAHLLGLQHEECAIKKGAVWWLRYREREGQASTVVVTVQTPELL